jgi:cardiolipin synthase (CMP-forming)
MWAGINRKEHKERKEVRTHHGLLSGFGLRPSDLVRRPRSAHPPHRSRLAVDAPADSGKIGSDFGMTIANRITIFRIVLIPFFVVEVLYYGNTGKPIHYFLGVISFAVAALCDGLDGYIARRFNQRSELGAILDPLADKLLLVSAIVLLSFDHPYLHPVPLWLTGTIIGRDVLLLLGLIVIQIIVGKVRVRPRLLGKVATVLQMAVVLWVLMKLDKGWLRAGALATALCTGLSGLLYLWDGTRQLSAHPASSPTAKQ